MAETKTSSKADGTRRYLKAVLEKNPIWQSDEILELRRKALRLKPAVRLKKASDSQSKDYQQRDAMRRAVELIQREFWSMPLNELQRRLEAIDTRRAPDQAPVIKRLRTTASCRGEFPKMAKMPSMHLGLFRAFKTAVVLPPADAGYVREQFLRSINDRKEFKQIKRSIASLEKQYPMLYALERDWFQNIRSRKKPPKAESSGGWGSQASEGTGVLEFFSTPVLIAVFLIGKMVLRFMLMQD
ncbi:MAG: hypothetical protein AAF664_22420 [Planctomycetota bacterium]